ncbi:APC family permease [Alteromonas sp. AMM-1]|uniref:APC family permease n=1 Tax=Alteromonas sp. AMM-1 TaxID=3394233 RepID=UPI0039A48AED
MNNQLVRSTHLGGAVIIGLGSILGTGAYVSVGLSASIAGNWLVWAVAIAAITALCNGLSSAQLASAHPVSGGTYEYGYRFLNPLSGKIAGGLFVVAKSASAATAALAVAQYLNSYLGMSAAVVKVIALMLLLLFTLFVLSGVRRTNWLNVILVAISLTGLFVFIGIAFSMPASHHQWTNNQSGGLSVFHAAALMFVAFTGYGRIATMGEEIVDPRRNIPRAVWLTLTLVSALYIVIGMAILHVYNAAVFNQATFNISDLVADASWAWVIVTGGVVAMCGVVLNLVLGVSRVILAMGRRGDLPKGLAKLDASSKSAPAATWLTFSMMAVIALLTEIEGAWTLSAFTVLVYYGITNLAALRVSKHDRFIPRWVSVAGLFSCVGLVVLAALA